MRFLFTFLLTLLTASATPRIALLPSFLNNAHSESRETLHALDSETRARLLQDWETELLSRAGLSKVLFEQKLRTTTDPEATPLLLLPSDLLVLSVVDLTAGELRLRVVPVEEGMTLPEPEVLTFENEQELVAEIPAEISAWIGKVAQLESRQPVPEDGADAEETSGQAIALLDPIATSGNQDGLTDSQASFRMVLEQSLTAGDLPHQLVERSQMQTLLNEQSLSSLEANSAAGLGEMVQADLMIIPYVYPLPSAEMRSNVFAVDVATGRILAADSWTTQLLESPPAEKVKRFLRTALNESNEAKEPTDDPEARYLEANFLSNLEDEWMGLAMSIPVTAESGLLFLDAAAALNHDNPEGMRTAFSALLSSAIPGKRYPLAYETQASSDYTQELLEMKESGRLAAIHKRAGGILEPAVRELLRDDLDANLPIALNYYLRLGEPKRCMELIKSTRDASETLAENDRLYERVAETLMANELYEETEEFVFRRDRFSSYAKTIVLDSMRARNLPDREFELIWNNRRQLENLSIDNLIRLLELGCQTKNAEEVLEWFSSRANAWSKNNPQLRLPLLRARIAAGQRERAASEAQSAYQLSKREGREELAAGIQALLQELDAEPTTESLVAADFAEFLPDTKINLWHDATIDAGYAAEVAQFMADFWGLQVDVFALDFDMTQVAGYEELSESMEGRRLAQALTLVECDTKNLLQTIFLTRHKLIAKDKNYTGNIYGCSSRYSTLSLVSDYYFDRHADFDPRSTALETAIACSSLPRVSQVLNARLREDGQGRHSPPPPDLFAANGELSMKAMDLAISQRTGDLLAEVTAAQWFRDLPELRRQDEDRAEEKDPENVDQFESLSDTIENQEPVTIQPVTIQPATL